MKPEDRIDSLEKFQKWFIGQFGYTCGCTEGNWVGSRESYRIAHSERILPFWTEDLPYPLLVDCCEKYYVHLDPDNPLNIRYYQTEAAAKRDIPVSTTPGRFLTKHFKDDLTEKRIASIAATHRSRYSSSIVHFAMDAIDIQHVYKCGPGACMSSTEDMEVPEHPVRVYDGPDTAIAYLQDDQGRIFARAIVFLNESPLAYGRLYGDSGLLSGELHRMGFVNKQGPRAGTRLRLVKKSSKTALCPYIDYTDEVKIGSKWLTVTEDGNGRCCNNTNGWCGGECCSSCDEAYDEDDLTQVYSSGNLVCSYCRSDCYQYAIVDARGTMRWCDCDDVAHIDSIGWFYPNPAVLQHYKIVEIDDEFHSQDECVRDVNGDWQLKNNVVALQTGGYMYEYDAVELDTGGWYDPDNLPDGLELVDGQLLTKEAA